MNTQLKVLALSVLCALGHASTQVDFAGSSTIQPLMEALQVNYQKAGVKARILGGGSSMGVKSVLSKMAQVGMVSRELTETEKKDLAYFSFAKDALAIIVNKANPLSEMSTSEIQAIYKGDTRQWSNKEVITLVNKSPGRATLEVFETYFNLKGKIRKDAVTVGANGHAVEAVAGDPNAIGYVSLGDALAAEKNGTAIKVLKLDGVVPSPANTLSGKYKLSRPLNLVYLPERTTELKKVFDVVYSEAANKIILEHNFIPEKRK